MIERFFHFALPSLVSPRRWLQQTLFWGGAIAVALVAIVFAKASSWGNSLFDSVIHIHPFLAFVLTPAGFAGVVWLTRSFFPGAEGSGIPQTIATIDASEIANRQTMLSLRVTLGKIILTTIGLCAGASIGREGPTVQIGAAIMHKLGRLLKIEDPRMQRALILAGGAAGIAAAFNTPLAGIIFAIEELSHSFEEKTSGTALTAVMVAGIVSMGLLGNYTYFGHTSVALNIAQAWQPVLFCGIAGGLMGGAFARTLIFFSHEIPGRVGVWIKERPVAFAAGCGFVLALLGQFSDLSIFGTGYNEAKSLIEGTRDLPATYGVMKLAATAVSYISGLPGGLFAPSLAVGAGLGANFSSFLPALPAAAVVILGMVGYFTGVVQVPITATIIVMEMTDDQSLTVPLLATAFLAYAFSRLVCPTSLYRTLARAFLDNRRKMQKREPIAQTTEPCAPSS